MIADELGPSLRWATAQVERTPRKDGQGGGGAPRGGASGGGPAEPYYGDEEPF